jgi:hypothetical protein
LGTAYVGRRCAKRKERIADNGDNALI